MKTEEQKARIREMFRAEALQKSGEARSAVAWLQFKEQMRTALDAGNLPTLEIKDANRGARRVWRLVPLAALCLVGILLYWHLQTNRATGENPALKNKNTVAMQRTMHAGDVYTSGKRKIRFTAGAPMLRESENGLRLEGDDFKADFSLKQKTNLTIEHPLVRVTVTGTEFTFSAAPQSGGLALRAGSVRVDFKRENGEPLILRAPAHLVFDTQGHALAKKPEGDIRLLYRFELVDGEIFFGHLLEKQAQSLRVEVLGGAIKKFALVDVARFVVVEAP